MCYVCKTNAYCLSGIENGIYIYIRAAEYNIHATDF